MKNSKAKEIGMALLNLDTKIGFGFLHLVGFFKE